MINGTFGIFLVPVTHALGWSGIEFSIVLLVMVTVSVVGYPVNGRMADRYGVRPVALIGNASFACCVVSFAFSTNQRWLVYGLYAITGLAATLSGCILLMKPISLWFTRHRGLLFALIGVFEINIGVAIMPFLAVAILASYGWRAAYVGLGALAFLVGLPAMMLLQSLPIGAIGTPALEMRLLGLTSREARRQPVFWLLMFSVALGAGSLSAMLTHIVPLLTDRGILLATATTASATTALCNATWQIIMGMMLDRTHAPRFADIFLIVSIVGLVLIGGTTSSTWLIVGAVLLGIGSGTECGLLPCVIPCYFELFSEIYGTVFGVAVLVSGFTPTLMGLAFDSNGNYDLALGLIAAALSCGAVLIFFMPRYGSKWLAGVLADETSPLKAVCCPTVGMAEYYIGVETKGVVWTLSAVSALAA